MDEAELQQWWPQIHESYRQQANQEIATMLANEPGLLMAGNEPERDRRVREIMIRWTIMGRNATVPGGTGGGPEAGAPAAPPIDPEESEPNPNPMEDLPRDIYGSISPFVDLAKRNTTFANIMPWYDRSHRNCFHRPTLDHQTLSARANFPFHYPTELGVRTFLHTNWTRDPVSGDVVPINDPIRLAEVLTEHVRRLASMKQIDYQSAMEMVLSRRLGASSIAFTTQRGFGMTATQEAQEEAGLARFRTQRTQGYTDADPVTGDDPEGGLH